MVARRKLLLIPACRLCGSTKIKTDAVALECTGCGAIRPRKTTDERIVAAIAGWEDCPLSAAELRVLRKQFDGRTYEQTALDLGLATSTVRTHLHNSYTKLKVPGAVQACVTAYERGWLRADEKGRDRR